jgi:uncharacterized protein YlxW (UPF0749 family)
MTGMNLAIEIFEAIESDVGRDNALKVAKSVDAVVFRLEEQAREHSYARKVEIKDELKTELRDELATKADLANDRTALKGDIADFRTAIKSDIADLRAALKGDIASLKMRITIQFVVTLFVIVLMNPQSLQLIGRMLGLVK